MDIAKVVLLACIPAALITIIFYLLASVVHPTWQTAKCYAPHVMEQKRDNKTSRPSPSRTELGIDI
jgi:hypothetical protein